MTLTRKTTRASRLFAMAAASTATFATNALEPKLQLSFAAAEVIANACLAEQAKAKHSPVTLVVVDDVGIPLVI